MNVKEQFEFQCMEHANKNKTFFVLAYKSPFFPNEILLLEWRKGKWNPNWFPIQTLTTKEEIYKKALNQSIKMMQDNEGLEPTSAFKQAASDHGIPEGEEMAEFVNHAGNFLFNNYA